MLCIGTCSFQPKRSVFICIYRYDSPLGPGHFVWFSELLGWDCIFIYWMSIYLNIHKSVLHKIYCELLQLLRLAVVLNYNVKPVTFKPSLTVSESYKKHSIYRTVFKMLIMTGRVFKHTCVLHIAKGFSSVCHEIWLQWWCH